MVKFFKYAVVAAVVVAASTVAAEKPDSKKENGAMKSVGTVMAIRLATFKGFAQIACAGVEASGRIEEGSCERLRQRMQKNDD